MIRVCTKAVPIYYVNHGEADRIVTFITEDIGRLSAFANGARKLKNRFGGSIEPFRSAILTVSKRKETAPFKIEEIHTEIEFKLISKSFEKMVLASYISKLAFLFTREENRDRNIYNLLLSFFGLTEQINNHELLARLFEIRLFSVLGYKLEMFRCSSCSSLDIVYLSLDSGGVICKPCSASFVDLIPAGRGTMAFIRAVQDMELSILNRLRASSTIIAELKYIYSCYVTKITGRTVLPYEPRLPGN